LLTSQDVEIIAFDGSPAQAASLCQVAVAALGEHNATPAAAARLLATPTARVWLARRAGQIIGFVCTFETDGLAGRRLWS
jgi:hypothetical protein